MEKSVISDIVNPISSQTVATDTNAACKSDKPRLAEVLGVEVGERFRVPVNGGTLTFWVTEKGYFKTDPPEQVGSTYLLLDAINHPESIIRAPRLTEPEIVIMRALGAKWVSRDDYPDAYPELWEGKPELAGKTYACSTPTRVCIVFREGMFQSVRPGDCISVEEAGGDA